MIKIPLGYKAPKQELNYGSDPYYMFRLPCLTILALFFCPIIVFAQDIGDSIEILVRPYAGLRGYLAVYDDGMEVQENGIRIPVNYRAKKMGQICCFQTCPKK